MRGLTIPSRSRESIHPGSLRRRDMVGSRVSGVVPSEADWLWAIDSPLPPTLRVGAGSAMFVSGWIFHRRSPLRELALRLGDGAHDVPTHSMPRLDVYVAMAEPGDEPATTAYRSGFWAVLPVHGVATPADVTLSVVAVNQAGERFEAALSTIGLQPARAV